MLLLSRPCCLWCRQMLQVQGKPRSLGRLCALAAGTFSQLSSAFPKALLCFPAAALGACMLREGA